MKRNRRIAVISHCILNQNAVLTEWERAPGAFKGVVRDLLVKDVSLLQLPCPEMTYGGVNRPPLAYADYDTPEFRAHCIALLTPSISQINRLAEDGCTLELLMGIENSPCCDLTPGKGVFMEELLRLLPPEVPVISRRMVPESYREESDGAGS